MDPAHIFCGIAYEYNDNSACVAVAANSWVNVGRLTCDRYRMHPGPRAAHGILES